MVSGACMKKRRRLLLSGQLALRGHAAGSGGILQPDHRGQVM
jgi:hypothetical protein